MIFCAVHYKRGEGAKMAIENASAVELPAAADYDEIVQFIETGYINAFHEADFAKLRRLFHEDSLYFFTTRDGTLYKGAFDDDEVRGWAESEQDWEHTILSVTQAGDVASVILEMRSKSDPGSAWVDIHALLRIDGEWHDMNKTATHASRADWAGAGEPAPGDPPDRDQIVRVAQLYIDGFNEADGEKLREAFHPDAWIAFTDKAGDLHSHRIYDGIDDWGPDPGDPPIYGRIISVTQAGDVASVLLGFDWTPDPADGWVDIHSLLRLDGSWKIMNKTATHASRAGWAAPEASTA